MGQPEFGVLFDIDDTLVDFAGAARLALIDVAASFDSPASGSRSQHDMAQHVLRCWEVVSEREYSRFLAGEFSFDDMLVSRMAAVVTEMDPAGVLSLDPVKLELLRNESIFGHYRTYDDVPACLARFQASGVKVGVVSNSDGDYQRRKMAVAGLSHLTNAAVFSGDLGFSKPDPEIFLAGAVSLGLTADRVVYVGDRWATDAVGALTAGLSAVWLNRLGLTRPPGAAEQLDAIADSDVRLAELTSLEELDAEFAGRLLSG